MLVLLTECSTNEQNQNCNLLKPTHMKKKVKLNDVSVSSFITNLDNDHTALVKGGSGACANLKTLDDCLTGNYPTLGNCTDTLVQQQTTNGTIC